VAEADIRLASRQKSRLLLQGQAAVSKTSARAAGSDAMQTRRSSLRDAE